MDPLSILFYFIILVFGVVILYFIVSLFYVIFLNLFKFVVIFFYFLLGICSAAYLWSIELSYIAIPVLVAGFVVSLITYPKKKRIELTELNNVSYVWTDSARGRLLNKIDRQISKPKI